MRSRSRGCRLRRSFLRCLLRRRHKTPATPGPGAQSRVPRWRSGSRCHPACAGDARLRAPRSGSRKRYKAVTINIKMRIWPAFTIAGGCLCGIPHSVAHTSARFVPEKPRWLSSGVAPRIRCGSGLTEVAAEDVAVGVANPVARAAGGVSPLSARRGIAVPGRMPQQQQRGLRVLRVRQTEWDCLVTWAD
jgi:hypothetical protein